MTKNKQEDKSNRTNNQDAVLIQRYVSGSHKQARWVVKDPSNGFSVIGVIRKSQISQDGKQTDIYNLYSIKGKELGSDTNFDYIMTEKVLEAKPELIQDAQEKQQEANVRPEAQTPAAPEKNTTRKPAAKQEVKEKETEVLER